MPELERPDGARIHYEVRGEGPPVFLTVGLAATPDVYDVLAAELVRDHAVVTWDLRGCGRSSQHGPLDIETDGEDLAALIASFDGSARLFAVGHGVNMSAYAALRVTRTVRGVVAHGITTALLSDLGGADGLAASPSVMGMLVEQLRRDPRAAVRSIIGSLNPQLGDDELRRRVDTTIEYAGVDQTLQRLESWFDKSALAELRELGPRLCVLSHEGDQWQAGTLEAIEGLLPAARVRHLDDGPLSRPDLTAALIRDL